jgi:hypothetical protein
MMLNIAKLLTLVLPNIVHMLHKMLFNIAQVLGTLSQFATRYHPNAAQLLREMLPNAARHCTIIFKYSQDAAKHC